MCGKCLNSFVWKGLILVDLEMSASWESLHIIGLERAKFC